MKKKTEIKVKGNTIAIFKSKEEDYISLTDIAKHKNPNATGLVISHWLSTRYTIDFMGLWEKMHNPDFNVTEFRNIRNESGSNGFVLSRKNWINSIVQKMHIPRRVVTSEKKQLFGNSEQLKKTQLSQILRQLLNINRAL